MKRVQLITCLLLLVLLMPAAVSALGNISVSSSPIGATIYIDGVSSGTTISTPLTIQEIAVGSRLIVLQLSGYQNYTTSVTVVDGGTHSVSATLTPNAAAPTITSVAPSSGINSSTVSNVVITGTGFSLSGASVVLAQSGQANVTGSCSADDSSHLTCSFAITGKPAGSRNVIVTNSDGQSVTLTSGFEILSSATAVTLTSITPSGALPNTTVSITGLVGTNFESSATMRLRRSGYNDIYGTVGTLTSTLITGTFNTTNQVPGDYQVCVINPGSTAVCGLTFTITSPTAVTNGSILFESNPSGASVYVGNVLKGTSTFTLYNLTPGSYDIIMKMSGYESYTKTVTVTSGTKTSVYGKLEPIGTTTATTVPVTTAPATVRTTRTSTLAAPTPWPSDTPTPASPSGTIVVIAGIGLAFVALRRR